MRQYLTVGIVYEVDVLKKECPHASLFDAIVTQLAHGVNLNKYARLENETYYALKMKENVLSNGLVDFLKEQWNIYYGGKDACAAKMEKLSSFFDQLETLKTSQKIRDFVIKEGNDMFQQIGSLAAAYDFYDVQGIESPVPVHYDLLAFLRDGKILMEDYDHMFYYLGQMVQLQTTKHPIADCVKVMMTG